MAFSNLVYLVTKNSYSVQFGKYANFKYKIQYSLANQRV